MKVVILAGVCCYNEIQIEESFTAKERTWWKPEQSLMNVFNMVDSRLLESVISTQGLHARLWGESISASSIVKYLKSENCALSIEPIYNYLKWLTEAFLIYP